MAQQNFGNLLAEQILWSYQKVRKNMNKYTYSDKFESIVDDALNKLSAEDFKWLLEYMKERIMEYDD